MCAASQQIDVIPNQGHDGIEAGNLGLMFAHAGAPPLFTLSLTGLMQAYWTRAAGSETARRAETILHNLVI